MKIKLTLICLLFFTSSILFSQKSYGVFLGLNAVDFLGNSNGYRFYSEDHSIGQTLGIRYMSGNSKYLKTFDLLLKHRKNRVSTFNGGIGGGTNNSSLFDLTMIYFISKINLREFQRSKYIFYVDGGISLGFVATHYFENEKTVSHIFSTPQSVTTFSNDLSEFLYKVDFGVVFDFGVVRPLNSSIDFFFEIQLGASFFTGKPDYTKVLGTTGLRFGVMKLIESE